MNTIKARVGSATCILLALVGTANAQEKQQESKASHRMEIYNGPYRTVHHFADGASEADQAKLRDAEQRENEVAVTNQLNALLRQYLADESVLQRRRRAVQLQYYGHSNVVTEWLFSGPYPHGFDGFYGYYGGPYYGGGYLGGYVPGTVTSFNGLSGVGDEGPMKAELIRALAGRLGPKEVPPPPATK